MIPTITGLDPTAECVGGITWPTVVMILATAVGVLAVIILFKWHIEQKKEMEENVR